MFGLKIQAELEFSQIRVFGIKIQVLTFCDKVKAEVQAQINKFFYYIHWLDLKKSCPFGRSCPVHTDPTTQVTCLSHLHGPRKILSLSPLGDGPNLSAGVPGLPCVGLVTFPNMCPSG